MNNSRKLNTIIRCLSAGIFLLCIFYLSYEMILRPYLSDRAVIEARNLYKAGKETATTVSSNNSQTSLPDSITEDSVTEIEGIKNSAELYDAKGRLKEFSKLMALNEDVKGWLSITGTNIDYPILQSDESDPEYYLYRNINKKYDKAGSLFLNTASSLEENTKNLVIYGHNMKSTNNMFHQLLRYDKLEFYKEHPYITFNSIYAKGQWKIISVIKADANLNDDFFNFARTSFANDEDYLAYIYELRIRSLYHIPVDANEEDELLTLVTCSYELDNYRTVIIARKIRDTESLEIDTQRAVINPNTLYPDSWYLNYNSTKPLLPSFDKAFKSGSIDWYKP